MKTVINYPVYQKTTDCLFAFVAKDKMYKIEARGTNMNNGLCIDEYITRRMVLKYFNQYGAVTISKADFERLYNALFYAARQKMI